MARNIGTESVQTTRMFKACMDEVSTDGCVNGKDVGFQRAALQQCLKHA